MARSATPRMLEPLGVALHSVDLGHLPFGGTASVVGCGPIGLLLIGVLKAARAISLAARGVIDLGSLVSSRAGLGSAAAAFGEAARRTGLKVLIELLRCAVTLCRLGWGSCVRCGWRRCSTCAACWRS